MKGSDRVVEGSDCEMASGYRNGAAGETRPLVMPFWPIASFVLFLDFPSPNLYPIGEQPGWERRWLTEYRSVMKVLHPESYR